MEIPSDDDGDPFGPDDRPRRCWSRCPTSRSTTEPGKVPERARRRTFTAQCKWNILAEYDGAEDRAKGALLRREGLYSSHIVEWRRARDAGALAGLSTPRGRNRRDPQTERIAQLEADNKRVEQELAKARLVVDVQAKLHALLETISESAEPDTGSTK